MSRTPLQEHLLPSGVCEDNHRRLEMLTSYFRGGSESFVLRSLGSESWDPELRHAAIDETAGVLVRAWVNTLHDALKRSDRVRLRGYDLIPEDPEWESHFLRIAQHLLVYDRIPEVMEKIAKHLPRPYRLPLEMVLTSEDGAPFVVRADLT